VRLRAGNRTFTHGGDWPGWTAKTVREPATSTAVALLSRCPDPVLVSDTAIAIAIATHLSTAS